LQTAALPLGYAAFYPERLVIMNNLDGFSSEGSDPGIHVSNAHHSLEHRNRLAEELHPPAHDAYTYHAPAF